MDSGDPLRRRKSLQERLGLVCCGSTTWGIEQSTIDADDHDDGNGDELDEPVEQLSEVIHTLPESNSDPDCVFPSPRMNLAAALAAERQSRSTDVVGESLTLDNENESSLTLGHRDTTPATPARMSLMKLLEETTTEEQVEGAGMTRDDVVCCVCMGRKKGAAFIPCGHTFCRVCSRELWLNRGSCPLCNRSILEILDIF